MFLLHLPKTFFHVRFRAIWYPWFHQYLIKKNHKYGSVEFVFVNDCGIFTVGIYIFVQIRFSFSQNSGKKTKKNGIRLRTVNIPQSLTNTNSTLPYLWYFLMKYWWNQGYRMARNRTWKKSLVNVIKTKIVKKFVFEFSLFYFSKSLRYFSILTYNYVLMYVRMVR